MTHFKKIFALGTIGLMGCAQEETVLPQDPDWTKDSSIEMNASFAAEENEEIEFFLRRHTDWKMTKTGTGLRYMIYDKSEQTDTVRTGDEVTVDFEISLLDGTVCYSSEENGPETFMVEKTDIESGLHEGVKYMCEGDRAKFILPSHIAHGLVGDTDKIPPLSAVVYDMHLIKIDKVE